MIAGNDRPAPVQRGLTTVVYAVTLGALATVLALGALKVGLFLHVTGGLDPSWVAAIGEAATRHDHFGHDIIFTAGPLTSLYTHYFNPLTWGWVAVSGAFVACSIGISFAALRPSPLAAALFIAALVTANGDALLMAVAVLAGLTVVNAPDAKRGALLMGAVAAAALTLAKFSVAPIALVVFAAADVLLLRQRRWPFALATFGVSLFALFVLTDGDAAAFPAFVRYSFETSAGYAAAMSNAGNAIERTVYLVAASILIGIFCFDERTARRRSGSQMAALAIMLGVYVFVSFKAGFVRHDIHSLAAWSGLGIVAALYACVSWQSHVRTGPRDALCGIVWASIVAVLQLQAMDTQKSWGALLSANASDALGSVSEIVAMIADRPAWLAREMSEREAARAALRAQAPLPALDGTVDIVASQQSRLIASGLDYRPRFTVQEYTSFTPDLIARNRANLEGPAAPKHLFVAPGSIDGRYPASAEGASWPDYLRFYAPQDFAGDLLLLTRRDHALSPLLGREETAKIAFDTAFVIPQGPVFLTLDIRLNILGKVIALLFKPPEVTLRLKDESGREAEFRLIPGQAAAGFLVSPVVMSARDMAALWTGPEGAGRLPRLVEGIVRVAGGDTLFYTHVIRMTMQQVDLSAAQVASPASPAMSQ